jgi:hypothetical protein
MTASNQSGTPGVSATLSSGGRRRARRGGAAGGVGVSVRSGDGGGLYKLNPVVTHSLKAPGFNPCTYEIISWFSLALSLSLPLSLSLSIYI